jgi:ankyrin repeat protein
MMEQAVRDGADPNYFGLNGLNALTVILGAPNRNMVSAKKLIELGADLSRLPRSGPSAAWLLEAGNDLAIAEWVLKNGGDPYSLTTEGQQAVGAAVEADRLDNIELLVRYGLDVNRESQGDTGALTAARLGKYKILLYFLKNGYNNNLKSVALGVSFQATERDPEKKKALKEVIAILKERGQKWPPDNHSGPPKRHQLTLISTTIDCGH